MRLVRTILGMAVLSILGAGSVHADWGMGPSMSGVKVPLLLLAVAAGYWVLTLSQTVNKPLDTVGRFIGGMILIVSLGGLLCTAVFGLWCKWKMCGDPAAMQCGGAAMTKRCFFDFRKGAKDQAPAMGAAENPSAQGEPH